MNSFVFETHNDNGYIQKIKYRLKECLTLAIIWLMTINVEEGKPILIHSFLTRPKLFDITKTFCLLDSAVSSIGGAPSVISVTGAAKSYKVLSLIFIIPLLFLPNRILISLTSWILEFKFKGVKPSKLIVFCDAHLAGYILSLAATKIDLPTATLQHGLYRCDDQGSVMAFKNFVSDEILLWDMITANEFRKFGVTDTRLNVVGQYKVRREQVPHSVEADLIFLCPPYSEKHLEYFNRLADILDDEFKIRMSVHPLLRSKVEKVIESLSDSNSIPSLCVCGDSGVIIDALVKRIPVITIGSRKLASCHLTYEEFNKLTKDGFVRLKAKAIDSLESDMNKFGILV